MVWIFTPAAAATWPMMSDMAMPLLAAGICALYLGIGSRGRRARRGLRDLHRFGHFLARFRAAPADLGALLHLGVALSQSLAVLGARQTDLRANSASAAMQLGAAEHEVRAR